MDEDTETNRSKKSRKTIETMTPTNTITPMIIYKWHKYNYDAAKEHDMYPIKESTETDKIIYLFQDNLSSQATGCKVYTNEGDWKFIQKDCVLIYRKEVWDFCD